LVPGVNISVTVGADIGGGRIRAGSQ